MHRSALGTYRCPYSGELLRLKGAQGAGDEITSASLVSESGLVYPVSEGMAHLIQPDRESYSDEVAREQEYYESTARGYDALVDWVFASFREDESRVRAEMIDLLRIDPDHRVLETGAGTGRDTSVIAERLGSDAQLFVQDLSASMLSIGRGRLLKSGMLDGSHGHVDFSVGNARQLPFPDDFFDSAYHFGGLNLFGDKRAALAEMARVVRTGGRVVVGDEGLAPWHRNGEYGAILMNSNRLYKHEAPIEFVPECAREVRLRWLIGNAFYVIDFTVAGGPPEVDLDLPIHGQRGGTHRTRYFGVLEGVTPEAKQMAQEAAEAGGLTMHEWLDQAVRAAAGGLNGRPR